MTTPTTESVDPRYADLDRMSTLEMAKAMNDAEKEVPRAVEKALPQIVAAVDAIASGMKKGGRLFYVGAGTAGRMGVLDASECPPTFSSDPSQVVGMIAGGDGALRKAVEGAEDDFEEGARTVQAFNLTNNDTVVGIAASGRTPFTLGAVEAGNAAGATTVGISCNAGSALAEAAQHPIEVVVGPEVITGSTRLKAGSAQKQVLNMLSTLTMVKLGKTYGNLMVDLQATNEKLEERSRRLVTRITGVDDRVAQDALELADGSVKKAVVMIEKQLDAAAAEELLNEKGGFLRAALETS